MKLETIMWLLPVAFMIHDFEEIVFMKAWVRRKESYLTAKVPHFAKSLILHFKELSTAALTLMVAEEFLLLSLTVKYDRSVLCMRKPASLSLRFAGLGKMVNIQSPMSF